MMASINDSLSLFAEKVTRCVEAGQSISVTTHMDCDGLAAGAIITKALVRAGARCSTRSVKELDADDAASLGPAADLYVITDLGGGSAAKLDAALGESWIVLDHHQVPQHELDHPRVINSWKFGIDGGIEICAGGMAYLAATALDGRNADMAPVAVIAALGDRQDQGEKKSLAGKNLDIAKKAEEIGLLETSSGLLLVGRETRPLAESIELTARPFIEGLTWNGAACRALLDDAGIEAMSGGRYRTPADLDEDERRKLVDIVSSYGSGGAADKIADELVGQTYTLTREAPHSFLRDGREFATLLNSCGRSGRAGTGMAVCMGDRGEALDSAQAMLTEYRAKVRELMMVISGDRWRTTETGSCVMVNAEGLVGETMTGTISSIIAGAPRNAGKVIVLRAGAEGGRIKFSSRKAFGYVGANLGEVMREAASRFGGMGGGHDTAAGARISKDKLGGFLDYVEDNVSGVQDPDKGS